METTNTVRPGRDEYAEFYETYVSLVPETDIVSASALQLEKTLDFLHSIPGDRACYSYEPGKWTVMEVMGHMIDTERVFAYRAFAFARGTREPLPDFDQNESVRLGDAGNYEPGELVEEFRQIRLGNISFLRHLGRDAWSRRGIAAGCEVTVRAMAYMMVGHERHHLRILRTRYFRENPASE